MKHFFVKNLTSSPGFLDSRLLKLLSAIYLRWIQDTSVLRSSWDEYGSKQVFTMTAEILARSLANFYRHYADRHMNVKFVRRVSERERAIRPFQQIDVSF